MWRVAFLKANGIRIMRQVIRSGWGSRRATDPEERINGPGEDIRAYLVVNFLIGLWQFYFFLKRVVRFVQLHRPGPVVEGASDIDFVSLVGPVSRINPNQQAIEPDAAAGTDQGSSGSHDEPDVLGMGP
jgi:hypothetical protein